MRHPQLVRNDGAEGKFLFPPGSDARDIARKDAMERKFLIPLGLARAYVGGTVQHPELFVEYRTEWDIPVVPATVYGVYYERERKGSPYSNTTQAMTSLLKTEEQLQNEYGQDLSSQAKLIDADAKKQFGELWNHSMFVPVGIYRHKTYFEPFLQPVLQTQWDESEVDITALASKLPDGAVRDGKYIDLDWYLREFAPVTGQVKWLESAEFYKAYFAPTKLLQGLGFWWKEKFFSR